MAPYLHDGDRGIVVRRSCRKHIRSGMVIVFEPPGGVRSDVDYLVKRVVAVGGDVEPGWLPIQYRSLTRRVPNGLLLVRGDAFRSSGSDTFGPIPVTTVRGVVVGRVKRSTNPVRRSR